MTAGEPAKWSRKQRQEITEAFGPRKQRSNAFGIYEFIEKAAAYKVRLDSNPSARPSEVRSEMECAQEAAATLAKAMENLSQEALRQIVVAGAKLQPASGAFSERTVNKLKARYAKEIATYSDPWTIQARAIQRDARTNGEGAILSNSWPGKRQAIEALKDSILILIRDTMGAREMFKPSRGQRADDDAALALVSYLFFWWWNTFGKKPSINKNSEFHQVASAVARLYKLRVGSKILRKADLDRAGITIGLPSPQ
jgi:hypothetical protein